MALQPAALEVYNDANGELVNAFKQARHHPEALISELVLMPNSRAELAARRVRHEHLTEIQRAAWFLHNNLISFGGEGTSFGVTHSRGWGANSLRNVLCRKIIAFAERFDRVVIECLDWRRLLDLYDTPNAFFFLDPPYLAGKQRAYAAWPIEHWRELRERLRTIKGRWLLTCGAQQELAELFAGCRRRRVTRPLRIGGRGRQMVELIITPP